MRQLNQFEAQVIAGGCSACGKDKKDEVVTQDAPVVVESESSFYTNASAVLYNVIAFPAQTALAIDNYFNAPAVVQI